MFLFPLPLCLLSFFFVSVYGHPIPANPSGLPVGSDEMSCMVIRRYSASSEYSAAIAGGAGAEQRKNTMRHRVAAAATPEEERSANGRRAKTARGGNDESKETEDPKDGEGENQRG